METKWSSLVSYGMTVEALTDFLPLDAALAINTVRHDTLKVAERLEAELGDEQWSFIDGCPRDWAALPIPDGPITVGIDGGYVRHWCDKKGLDHGIGHFMFFEADSEARALDPLSPKSPQTSSAASYRKSALLPSSRPVGSGKSCAWW